ncbi:tumor necrosis factor ligand superfamily member 8 [Bos indicus]|uniref:Tumor necrosis factor ligand superfamily member 8 n=3 Tax=Bos TaxID=9903 RepID=F1MGQ7_BOVIN|nr:PREDICTED: tumor necrosis factor ligand superfamily member 8 [Bos indicus]XP_027406421.1 tumor necrosis factor ligand superfamily member 8 [Bos indicus x Bos taurus]DAA26473.1 TPA: tumor necrosis factor (ligand) superfamily, member 8 [Bos taurus]
MDPGPQRALNPLAPSQDTAMHVPAGSVTSHWGTTGRGYFCFTTASLALCLVFAVATIMVLVVQKTDSIPNPPGQFPLKGGNCSEDISCILKRAPFKKSWAYLQVSKHINKTQLSWNKDGIIHGVRYQDENLVIQFPGWYFIICQLQFLVKCPEHAVDLKLELLINKDVKKQTLVTVCESGAQTKNIYQNLSQFLLEHLQVNTTISVKVDKFQYVDTNTFPLENVLSLFLYSSSD